MIAALIDTIKGKLDHFAAFIEEKPASEEQARKSAITMNLETYGLVISTLVQKEEAASIEYSIPKAVADRLVKDPKAEQYITDALKTVQKAPAGDDTDMLDCQNNSVGEPGVAADLDSVLNFETEELADVMSSMNTLFPSTKQINT